MKVTIEYDDGAPSDVFENVVDFAFAANCKGVMHAKPVRKCGGHRDEICNLSGGLAGWAMFAMLAEQLADECARP